MNKKHIRGFSVCLIYGLAFCMLLSGCGVQTQESFRWYKGQTSPPPSVLNESIPAQAEKISFQKEKMVYFPQTIEGAELKGAFTKLIYNEKNEIVFIDRNQVVFPPKHLGGKIKSLLQERGDFLAQLKKENVFLALSSDIKMKLEVSRKALTEPWELQWVISFLEPSQEYYQEVTAELDGRLGIPRTIGAHHSTVHSEQHTHAQGEGIVFPKGPQLSTLTSVPLLNLSGNGFLSGSTLSVQSALSKKAFSENNVFHYDPNDPRFDDVQVYFFIQTILDWFEKKSQIKLPFTLEVTVHSGGLQLPKNTAYYYDGKIRLGAGDGITYQNIPRDPSIVLHEASHAFIDALSKLPTTNEGGSLNEAFADVFAALILDHPHMAELSYIPGPYRRTLENQMHVSQLNGGLYHDSLVVSGTLWEIKNTLGTEKTFDLCVKILSRLGPLSKLSEFPKVTMLISNEFVSENKFSTEEADKISTLLAKRGWTWTL